ncbi:transglutaminase domain-containing protein [Polyangium mundeleinium]|uniref:Transglutaminase domain-containing protein n=1 Tax=Polyangium mundeleinium TaxID=2995306 RepID=A0ABT5EHE4_9BACT|nr:transglutaminase domain-containing protein [Polyangium mundeleinium]MDC0740171.1 transglutaminase domain-containing protein [Polyangium mundeleinium]
MERSSIAQAIGEGTRRLRAGASWKRGIAWVITLGLVSSTALAQSPGKKPDAAAAKKPAAGVQDKDKRVQDTDKRVQDKDKRVQDKGASAQPSLPKAPTRWTAAQPDPMVDFAIQRATAGGPDALAGLLVATTLDERATLGKVRGGLRAVAATKSPVAGDARALAAWLTPSPAGAAWAGSKSIAYDVAPDTSGLVRSMAILGPFQDKGEGIRDKEGPEAPGQKFNDAAARYSWGVYDVAWRRILPQSSTWRGVPLDLYVHPRAESCTYLASKVVFPNPPAGQAQKPVLVHVASTGKVRLLWDGADVVMSEEVHPRLVLDRLAAQIEPAPGPHLVAVKVCSGATSDEGRVRLRFTDEVGAPVTVSSSSDITNVVLPAAAEKKPGKAGKVDPAKEARVAAEIKPPKGVTRVKTQLEVGLDVGANPSPDVALRAAILRTLGGAEDARSPRAPGLLEAALRAKETPPDLLALAGYVSPFGAERSERLNLAFERGKAASDDATAAFAQRRLFESSLAARYPDWAIARVREAPLSTATDLEARLLKIAGRSQMGAQGAYRAHRDELMAMSGEDRGRAPTAVWAELSSVSRSDPQTALLAARKLVEQRAGARDSRYVSAFRVQGGAELERAAAESLAHQRSADELVAIGGQLLEAGRNAWAREVYYVATLVSPNKASAFDGLAAARTAVLADEARQGKPPSEPAERVTEALARALALEPTDQQRKAEIALRTRTPQGKTTMPDEQSIVQPSVFLARAKANPAKKGEVFDRQLHWTRVVTYHADRRVSQLMHYAREIVVEPRTESDLYEPDIPTEGDRTELLFARVHRKDGSIALPEEQGGGGRGAYVRWPKLSSGDVVEIAVRSWTRDPVGRRGDAPFYFIDYVGSMDTRPILFNEVVVDSPAASPLAVDVINGKADRAETKTVGDRVIKRFVWDNPTNVRDEPLAPPIAETVPVVVGSTFAGWGDFRTWYKSAIEGFSTPDERIKELAAELTKGKKTRDEKIRAVFDYVADSIRYVNYVSGEAWLPNRPQISLARKQGDCDDKAMLLITLLKAIGIEATEVLVQTRYTGQSMLLRSEKVAVPMFDHGIAYLPAKDGAPAMWLDATSPQSRLGPLPAMDARTLAFFIDDGPAKMIETPASSPDDHGIDAEWRIELDTQGRGKLTANERHVGDAAFELRTNLVEPDARKQWAETYLTGKWVPGVELKGEVGFDGALPGGAAKLSYEATSQGIARREGNELVVPVSDTATLTSQLAPLSSRTLPVVLPPSLAPRHETRAITIVPPEGYVFAELPPGGEEAGGEFGRAKIEFSPGEGGAVVVKRTLVFDLSTISVDKYTKWRAWLQRVDGLMHRVVRLVPGDASKTAPQKTAEKPSR